MRIRPVALLAALAVLAPFAVSLRAASPAFWQVSTLADFLKGDVDNVAIDSDGRVVLGRAVELVHETTAPFVWDLVPGPKGDVYAATGSEGRVLRIAPGGEATTVFDAAELQAQAIAVGTDGTLYVGTSPDGKVYAVAPDGTSSTFFDPDDKYIWALALAPDGTLYVATGEKGLVYRVGRDGTGTPFYTSRATNVTALAFDGDGHLLVGTESPGQLLRVDRAGKAFMLLDSSYREIHAIRVKPDGDIYVTAVSGRAQPAEARPAERQPTEPTTPAPVPTVTTEITVTAVGDVPVTQAATPRTEPRREARGAVYRIAPDGLWESVWESPDDSPYDVIIDGDGVLVSTGNKGKLYRVEGSPSRSTVIARAGGQQVTRFVRMPDGSLVFATSNPGKVFRLASRTSSQGTYESEVRDAGTVATWGTLRWTATVPRGTSVTLATRAGNSATPDDTWSDWSPAYTTPAGQAVTSPKARYLQWRATLTGNGDASPALTSVKVAYLPRNARPAVASITVHPPGIAFQRPFPTGDPELAGFDAGASDGRSTPAAASPAQASPGSPLGRRIYQKGLQTFVWKADDTDQDRLQFDIYFRRETESAWRPLRLGLWDPLYTWDTTSVPDGTYLVKVVVSDAPSNAPDTALTNERESLAFEIDNSAPSIENASVRVEGGRAAIRFDVRDAHSPVQRVEYSVDSVRWQTVFPDDGIADALVESFTIRLPGAVESEVLVRAVDALNNVATAVVARPERAER